MFGWGWGEERRRCEATWCPAYCAGAVDAYPALRYSRNHHGRAASRGLPTDFRLIVEAKATDHPPMCLRSAKSKQASEARMNVLTEADKLVMAMKAEAKMEVAKLADQPAYDQLLENLIVEVSTARRVVCSYQSFRPGRNSPVLNIHVTWCHWAGFDSSQRASM